MNRVRMEASVSMLPGFNHNIRYKDRVFHVQTEDNGVTQPVLVTQVFIGGHILAIERSSYREILDAESDVELQTEQIRLKMQDQHKRLLKNLVNHAYDDKIATYLGTDSAKVEPTRSADIAPTMLQVAVESENAPTEPPIPTGDLVVGEALPVADEIPDQVHSPVSGSVAPLEPMPLPRPATPMPKLVEDLGSADGIQDDDLFRVFDEELQKQVPWSPTAQNGALPPLDPKLFPDDATVPSQRPPRRPPPQPNDTDRPTAIAFRDRTAPDQSIRPKKSPISRKPKPPPEATTEVRGASRRMQPPPVADTLVDFGLPASLKEQLGQAKAALEQAKKAKPKKRTKTSDPRVARFRMPRSPSPSSPGKKPEKETQIDMALRRRASSGRNSRVPEAPDPSRVETVHDVDAAEVKAFLERKKAEQAEARKKKKDTPWADAVPADKAETDLKLDGKEDEDGQRPSILVVERSLDEVILSYLADED